MLYNVYIINALLNLPGAKNEFYSKSKRASRNKTNSLKVIEQKKKVPRYDLQVVVTQSNLILTL